MSRNVEEAFNKIGGGFVSAITAFEFLDNIYEPELFIQQAHRVLEEKGLLFLTTRCVSGFDLQILWENSKSIYPPHHVSLFSVEGLIQFFQSNGHDPRAFDAGATGFGYRGQRLGGET